MNAEMEMTNEKEFNEASTAAAEFENSSCVNCCQTLRVEPGSTSVDLTLDSDKISSALSAIYKLHYLTAFEDSPTTTTTTTTWNVDTKLCEECSTVFSSLWDLYDNFNQLRNLESCLAKEIQKLDKCIQTQEIMRRIKEEPVIEEDEKEDQVHHNFNDFSGGSRRSSTKFSLENLKCRKDFSDDQHDEDDNDPLATNSYDDDDDLDGCLEVSNGSKSDNVMSSGPWITLQKLENDPIAQNSIANLSSKRKASFEESIFQNTRVSARKSLRVEGQSTVSYRISSSEEETNDMEYSEESEGEDSESGSNSDEADSTNRKSKVAAPKKVSFPYSKRRRPKFRRNRATHINRVHNKVPQNRNQTLKLDENTFLFHGLHRIEKVTEPDGVFYKCGTCEFRTKNFTYCKDHIENKHMDIKRWVCEHCGHHCSCKGNLEAHLRTYDKYKFCGGRQKIKDNDSKRSADNSSQGGEDDSQNLGSDDGEDADNNVVTKTKLKFHRKITKDPKVGENIYEYDGKWRYERKLDDDGLFRLYCLSCSEKFMARGKIVYHIQQKHIKVKKPKPQKPRKKRDIRRPPKVGENFTEQEGEWRFERTRDEQGGLINKCLSCSYTSAYRYMLVSHIKLVHKKETSENSKRPQRTIQLDDNNFTYDDIYRIERVTESNGIFYKCGTCGVKKKTLDYLKDHLRQVHIDKDHTWICEQCGRTLSSKSKLKIHMVSHTDERKYVCEECGKLCKTRSSLKSHKEGHLDKAFVCETCGNRFSYQRSLHLHRKMYSHFAPPPPPDSDFHVPKICPTCKKQFAVDANFEKHVAGCRKKVKTPCDWCGKPMRPGYLAEHKTRSCPKRSEFSEKNESWGENTGKTTEEGDT